MPVLKNKSQGKYVNIHKGIVMDKTLALRDVSFLIVLIKC